MPKEYVVYRNGYIMVGGQSVEISEGQSVKKKIFENYPNFVREIETEEIPAPAEIVPPTEITPREVLPESEIVPPTEITPREVLPESEIVASVETIDEPVDFVPPTEIEIPTTVPPVEEIQEPVEINEAPEEPVSDDSPEESEPIEETSNETKKRGGRKPKTA
jgi:hypothetical protein